MKQTNDVWTALGEVEEDDAVHVLTKLFTIYEQILETDPKNSEALHFFHHLGNAIQQTCECNLNRR